MMRALMMAAMAALVALAGCKKPRTEMLVTVQTEGVRVPEDVAQIRVYVADREADGDSAVYDTTVALCTPTLTTGCYTLPLSAVLHPGAKQPNDTVKVQIDALSRAGTKVTSSAALFTFSPKQSLRLDFVLYAACIGVISCSERDQACGPDAMCTTLTPQALDDSPDLGPGSGGGDMSTSTTVQDLAAPPGSDLSTTVPLPDLATTTPPPGDLAMPHDFSIIVQPNDMLMSCGVGCSDAFLQSR